MREVTFMIEDDIEELTWVYDCGWYIKGCHPYRMVFFGEQILDQPIGITQFYKDTGIIPPRTKDKK